MTTRSAQSIRRLTREESQKLTRERLLAAARQVVARTGYGGASIDAIAAEAGFSKGAVYSNFDSKEAIFLELLARQKASELAELTALVDGAAPAEAMRVLEEWLHVAGDDVEWALLAMELKLHARRNAAFARHYDELEARTNAMLGELIVKLFMASGKVPPTAPAEVAAAIVSMCHGLVLTHGGARPGGKDPVATMTMVVLESLLAAAPAGQGGRPSRKPGAKRGRR
jgi:AcrR family transcriptional regulator